MNTRNRASEGTRELRASTVVLSCQKSWPAAAELCIKGIRFCPFSHLSHLNKQFRAFFPSPSISGESQPIVRISIFSHGNNTVRSRPTANTDPPTYTHNPSEVLQNVHLLDLFNHACLQCFNTSHPALNPSPLLLVTSILSTTPEASSSPPLGQILHHSSRYHHGYQRR